MMTCQNRMDKKTDTKKKWDQNKILAFLKFAAEKLKKSEGVANNEQCVQYIAIFLQLLKNDHFKVTLPKCSPHRKKSLVYESLLKSDLSPDELLLLGRSLQKNQFYSDLLTQVILVLFEKHLAGNEKVAEFLKTIWFDKDIIYDLSPTWSLYLTHWPTYLESTIFNILESLHSQSSQSITNIWNHPENHFLVKMCCKQSTLFQTVCEILNAMLLSTGCQSFLLVTIQQFISSVKEYCYNASDVVNLYPRQMQAVVMCCVLNLTANVKQLVRNLLAEARFMLSTHYPQAAKFLL